MPETAPALDAITQFFADNQERFLREWTEFLSFPSISTDPAHRGDCVDCANWLKDHLASLGFECEVLETSGMPLVFARRAGKPGKPVVSFYGHYDVQPVDPIEEWTTPPFEPTLRDGRLYARGAQDNKGQVFYVMKALEYLIESDLLDAEVKLFIEGEEESGSGGITDALPSLKDRLTADILMVCDTGTRALEVPTITMGLRGILGLTARLSGPKSDLHSGVHGGTAPNPAQQMARLAASLHDENGKIAVEDFYDGIQEPSDEDRELANQCPITAEMYEASVGVPPTGGERGLSFAERRGFRPTLEINGIHAGYGGPGMKTVIGREAILKLSSRTVSGMDAAKTLDRIEKHLRDRAPEGLTLEITEREIGGPGVSLSAGAPVIQKAREVLAQLSDQPVELSWEGASIPVVASLAETAGADALLVGFGLEGDKIHAPDESFSIDQLRKGFQYASLFLAKL